MSRLKCTRKPIAGKERAGTGTNKIKKIDSCNAGIDGTLGSVRSGACSSIHSSGWGSSLLVSELHFFFFYSRFIFRALFALRSKVGFEFLVSDDGFGRHYGTGMKKRMMTIVVRKLVNKNVSILTLQFRDFTMNNPFLRSACFSWDSFNREHTEWIYAYKTLTLIL